MAIWRFEAVRTLEQDKTSGVEGRSRRLKENTPLVDIPSKKSLLRGVERARGLIKYDETYDDGRSWWVRIFYHKRAAETNGCPGAAMITRRVVAAAQVRAGGIQRVRAALNGWLLLEMDRPSDPPYTSFNRQSSRSNSGSH
jgi:hypothetical protein